MNKYIVIKNQKRIWKTPLIDWTYRLLTETRSIRVNRFYRIYLTAICEEYANYGYIHIQDELHNIFKKYLLPRLRIKSDFSKKAIYQIWSTTALSNKEFCRYLDTIKLLCEFWELDKVGLEQIGGFILPETE